MLRTLADALRPQALSGFELPLAPAQVDELPASLPGAEVLRVSAPAGHHLILISTAGPLALAFEAALFDLLAESHFPVPAPKRARTGGLIAQLKGPNGPAAAACYRWPPGRSIEPELATAPQLIEVGRMLARLHQLGSAHPASVPDPCDGPALATRLPFGPKSDAIAEVLRRSFLPLPMGAVHGRPGPEQFLFVGDRLAAMVPMGTACSAPLLLDLAEAMIGWALPIANPMPHLRALLSGYKSLRRLRPEEKACLGPMLTHAAARADARSMIGGARGAPGMLAAVQSISPADLSALTA